MTARQALLAKISALPAERVAEVEDFVDFLQTRDRERSLVSASQAASEPSFAAVWSNPEDSDYDAL